MLLRASSGQMVGLLPYVRETKMKHLIPEIEIGKRYKVKRRVGEGTGCPKCGLLPGERQKGKIQTVTVVAQCNPHWICPRCDYRFFSNPAGYYSCEIDGEPDVLLTGIPYTDFIEKLD